MLLAKFDFGAQTRKSAARELFAGAAEEYLALLQKNGQTFGDASFGWSNGRFAAYTHVGRPDSIALRYHSARGKAARRAVMKLFGRAPTVRIIDDHVPRNLAQWERASTLYLYTDLLDESSAIRCGDSGESIPACVLPLTEQEREDLYFWARCYRSHDAIWIGSGALEIPAYKQLVEPESELSQSGRELCQAIERVTRKPTYYYLHRYWGRKQGEEARVCPLCGGSWRVAQISEAPAFFCRFDFRCPKCRLVSHLACLDDSPRYARLGEFRGRGRTSR